MTATAVAPRIRSAVLTSLALAAPEDVNQLRDPYVFQNDDGRLYLFYVGRGEDAIGLAQLERTTPSGSGADG